MCEDCDKLYCIISGIVDPTVVDDDSTAKPDELCNVSARFTPRVKAITLVILM